MDLGTVLLIGGAGYIGRHFVTHLLDNNLARELIIADLSDNAAWLMQVRSRYPFANIHYTKLDVRKPVRDQIGTLSARWIINLAAVHREPGHRQEEYFDTNLPGARNVCEYADQIGCSNLLFTSSIAVYGRTRGATDESKPLYPDTPYGISKLGAELIHEGWLKAAPGRKLVVVRPGVVYGPGDPGNILRMIRAIKRGMFVFPGNPNIHKSYAYVFGLVESMVHTMLHPDPFITYNYVECETETLDQLVKLSRAKLGVKAPLVRLPNSLLQLAAVGAQVLSGGKSEIHPARVRKVAKPSHIVPGKLKELGFPFRYDFASSLDHWMALAPEDFA